MKWFPPRKSQHDLAWPIKIIQADRETTGNGMTFIEAGDCLTPEDFQEFSAALAMVSGALRLRGCDGEHVETAWFEISI